MTTIKTNIRELENKELETVAAGKLELTPELHQFLQEELIKCRMKGYNSYDAICHVCGCIHNVDCTYDELEAVILTVWNNLDDRRTRVYHRSCWEND